MESGGRFILLWLWAEMQSAAIRQGCDLNKYIDLETKEWKQEWPSEYHISHWLPLGISASCLYTSGLCGFKIPVHKEGMLPTEDSAKKIPLNFKLWPPPRHSGFLLPGICRQEEESPSWQTPFTLIPGRGTAWQEGCIWQPKGPLAHL